jgi:hypothetical protein
MKRFRRCRGTFLFIHSFSQCRGLGRGFGSERNFNRLSQFLGREGFEWLWFWTRTRGVNHSRPKGLVTEKGHNDCGSSEAKANRCGSCTSVMNYSRDALEKPIMWTIPKHEYVFRN